MVKKNDFDSNVSQKVIATLMQHFPKYYFTADIDRNADMRRHQTRSFARTTFVT